MSHDDEAPGKWEMVAGNDGDYYLKMDGVVCTIPVLQGPQGPPGLDATLDLTYPGTQPTPAVRFDIDGWTYSFPTFDAARAVREKLMQMTLEGEL